MKHNVKRILSTLLCCCMMVGFVPVEVFAATDDFSLTFDKEQSYTCAHTCDSGGTEDDLQRTITPATADAAGSIQYSCDACGKSSDVWTIPQFSKDWMKVDPASVVYNGTAQTFDLTFRDDVNITIAGKNVTPAHLFGTDANFSSDGVDITNAGRYSVKIKYGIKKDEGGQEIKPYTHDGQSLYFLNGTVATDEDNRVQFVIEPRETTVKVPSTKYADGELIPDMGYEGIFLSDGSTNVIEQVKSTFVDYKGEDVPITEFKFHKAIPQISGSSVSWKADSAELTTITTPGVYFGRAYLPTFSYPNGETGQNYYTMVGGQKSSSQNFIFYVLPSKLNPLYVNDPLSDFTYIPAGDFTFVPIDPTTKAALSTSEAGEKTVQLGIKLNDEGAMVLSGKYLKVNVEKREVLTVNRPTSISDKYLDTPFAELNLPDVVTIQAEDQKGNKTFENVKVNWNESSYDPKRSDTQVVTGTLILDDASNDISGEVENPKNLTAEIVVDLMGQMTPGEVVFNDKTAVYTGDPIPHTINDEIEGVLAISYKYYNASYSSSDPPTDVGTYEVTATFSMKEGYSQIAPVTSHLYIIKADTTDTPNAPQLESATSTSITLKDQSTPDREVEYSLGGTEWQSSTTFTGLSPDSPYVFFARYKATSNTSASEPSPSSEFRTLRAYYTVTFHSNNGKDETAQQQLPVGFNEDLTRNTFTNGDLTFKGWARTPDATTPEFTDGQTIRVDLAAEGENVDLYAVWGIKEGSVTIEADKNTSTVGNPITITATATYDASAGLTESYIWYKDGAMVSGQVSKTLVLDAVEDSGTYYCELVLTKDGKTSIAKSNSVTVTITSGSIVIDPDNDLDISDLTYGQSLSDATITNNSGIDGTLSWETGTIKPSVADSNKTQYNIVFIPADTENYVTTIIPVTVKVNPAPLTVKANDATVTFGEEPVDNGVSYSGFVNGENQAVLKGTLTFTFGYKVGDPMPEDGKSTITPSGLTADNYTITFEPGVLTVSDKVLVITPDMGQSKVYGEEDPTFTYRITAGDADAAITGELGREPGEDAGTYAYTIGTLAAENYTITISKTAAKFEIVPYDMEIQWTGLDDEYVADGTDQSGKITATATNEKGESITLDVVFERAGEETPFKEVGTYVVKAKLPTENPNYTLKDAQKNIEMKDKADGTYNVTFPTASDIDYGQKLKDSQLTGGNGGTNGKGTYQWADPDIVPRPGKSSYTVIFTPSADDTTDYSTEVGYQPDGTIHRDVVIQVNGQQAVDTEKLKIQTSKPYDGTVYATIQASDAILINPDDDVMITISAFFEDPFVGDNKKVFVSFKMTGDDADKYVLPEDYEATGSITKAPLKITANDAVLEYGDPLIGNGFTTEGLAQGETLFDLDGGLTYSSDYEQFDIPGVYTITPTGVSSKNYDITFESGQLTVTNRIIKIVPLEGQGKKVGTADPVLRYQILEGVPLAGSPLQGVLSRFPGEELGEYKITQGTITSESNPYHVINFVDGVVFTISKEGPGGGGEVDPNPNPDPDPEVPDRDNIKAPELKSRTATKISLVIVKGAEYSIDNGETWQSSNIFTNLQPDTPYTFIQRYAKTETEEAGKISAPSTFKTLKTNDAPEYEINYPEETIDFEDAFYEVSRDPDFKNPMKPGDSVIPGETIYIRDTDTDGNGTDGPSHEIVLPERPEAPDIEINFKDETIDTTDDMEYSTDGGKTWHPCDDDMDISDLTGEDILVRYPATDDSFASDSDKVRLPDRPEAPEVDIDFKKETINTDSNMEYSTDKGKTWESCGKDMDISDLIGEDILIRYESSKKEFASESAEIEIPDRPSAPNVKIDYKKETINSTTNMEYSTDGGKIWKTCDKDMNVSDLMGKSIKIRTVATDKAFASEVKTINIPSRGTSPTVGWTDESENGKKDGKITNVTSAMEYSSDGGKTWKSCSGSEITGLQAGSYIVRYAATSSSFASYETVVTIGVGDGSGNTGGNNGENGNNGNNGNNNNNGGNNNNGSNNGNGSNNNNGSNNGNGSNNNNGSNNGNGSNNNNGSNNSNGGSNGNGSNGNGSSSNGSNSGNNGNGSGNGSDNGSNGNSGVPGTIAPGTCPSEKFVDVNQKLWYHDAIDYTYVNGFMIGISGSEWAPDAQMTKAMVMQVMYRIVGSGEKLTISGYSDVQNGDWYYDAVAWALNKGIATEAPGTFGSNEAVTYEQLATYIYNFCNIYGLTMVTGSISTSLTSNATTTEGQTALQALLTTGIFNVNGSTSISASGTMTRATFAQVITNFCSAYSSQMTSNTNIQGPTMGIYTNPGVTNTSGVPFI